MRRRGCRACPRFLKRIGSIDDEVREYLSQFAGEYVYKYVSFVSSFNGDVQGAEFAPVKREHIVD